MTGSAAQNFGALDALRGVAALGVVLFHSAFAVRAQGPVLENAALFVDFFFVLSGFVMAHAYRARIADGFGLGAFVVLRLGRLYPMHVLMLGLWVLYIAWAIPGGDPAFGHHMDGIVPHLTMLNSVGLQGHLSLNYPAWSVGAEFWGGLVFFAVVAVLRDRFGTGVALVLALGCYAALLIDGEETIQRSHDLGLLRCLGGFFLGVALQGAMARRGGHSAGTGAELMVVAVVLGLMAWPAGNLAVELLTVAAFAVLVAVFARSQGAVSRLLQTRVPAFLGRISYSIYIVHALILILLADALRASDWAEEVVLVHPVHGPQPFLLSPWAPLMNLGAVLLVIGVAALTYRCVEEPARQAARRWVRARRQGGLATT